MKQRWIKTRNHQDHCYTASIGGRLCRATARLGSWRLTIDGAWRGNYRRLLDAKRAAYDYATNPGAWSGA